MPLPAGSTLNRVELSPVQLPSEELAFQKTKVALHEKLIDSLDLTLLAEAPQSRYETELRLIAEAIVGEELPSLKGPPRERMVAELIDEVFGLGPLEPLLRDDQVSDILVNHPQEVYVERQGRLLRSAVVFADERHLMRIIQRIVSRVGRRIDEVSPIVDARLEDGSRINAVIPPLALSGPTLSIRRFGARPLLMADLLRHRTLLPGMAEFLQAAVEARVSVLVSGGTGAGKTTLLNVLSGSIPATERIISIEDSAELQLQHRHVIRLETRTENTDGAGEINQRTLLKTSLRMRPDRIIMGEVRGAEALDMLQAMNTGHEGSLTTIHANDTRDALARLELMAAMAGYELPVNVLRQYIACGITLVVHVSRLKGGARRVMRVSEIVQVQQQSFQLADIFGFEQTGVDAAGNAVGEFYVTGYRPACLSRLKAAGLTLAADLFQPSRQVVDG